MSPEAEQRADVDARRLDESFELAAVEPQDDTPITSGDGEPDREPAADRVHFRIGVDPSLVNGQPSGENGVMTGSSLHPDVLKRSRSRANGGHVVSGFSRPFKTSQPLQSWGQEITDLSTLKRGVPCLDGLRLSLART